MLIKICGMTGADDAKAALDMGADFVGFILYPPSPRAISVEALQRLMEAEALPGAVGVFVNTPPREVARIVRDCGLVAAQVHGDEPPDGFGTLPVPTWRATKYRGGVWQPDPATWRADRYVVDAAVPGMYGGTGVTADWHAAARLAADAPVMLSGGLTPENVAAGIDAVHPMGVDVASGVECEPGRKDHAKMRAFIEAARAVCGA